MNRRVVAIVLAVVMAAFGTTLVLLYTHSADKRAVASVKAVTVVVATKRIPAGTSGAQLRSDGYVERVSMPTSSVPYDALSSITANLDNLVVTSDLQPRQLVLRGMFGTATKATGGLSVPDGKFAVSLDVTVPGAVAGYVRPGSSVTVFDTYSTDGSSQGTDKSTRVLLSTVEVLAIGQYGTDGSTSSTPSDSSSQSSSSNSSSASTLKVTLAVSQAQAERLVQATQTGTLYLALQTGSSKVSQGTGVDNGNLFG